MAQQPYRTIHFLLQNQQSYAIALTHTHHPGRRAFYTATTMLAPGDSVVTDAPTEAAVLTAHCTALPLALYARQRL